MFLDEVTLRLNESNQVKAFYLEFTKANRRLLLIKLESFGIRGRYTTG